MCRHLAYLGPVVALDTLVTAPEHSLFRQAWEPRRQRHGVVNADGFGIGWYPDGGGEPAARYRRAVPIWDDANLPDLLRTARSGALLAAVRDITVGSSADESAVAPYRDGPWLFSHNGSVPDWTRLPVSTRPLEAYCDSVLLWELLRQRLRRGEPMAGALAALVREVESWRPGARLNLLLTDGRSIAASSHGDSLWYRARPGQVLVASEPDDDAPDWRQVPERSLLLAGPGGVRITELRPPAPRSRTKGTAMNPDTSERFTLDDRLPADHLDRALRADVERGLADRPRWLPPKWFYDARGSELFEEITRLPEYYPTRAEQEILIRRAPEIADLSRAASLAELGSGSSRKTRLLLDALSERGTLRTYAPQDVSPSALREAGEALCLDYPALHVQATVADFGQEIVLPDTPGPRLLAFLGSTIGNLDRDERAAFYRRLRRQMSGDDQLLLGADLVKDPGVLVRAYDDSRGVTAAFNRNVLAVLDRELGADFDPDAFAHRALWNADEERIEMHLVAETEQDVKIPALDLRLTFEQGESVRTEISCKFRRESLTAELEAAGLTVREWWTDEADRFALLLVVPSR